MPSSAKSTATAKPGVKRSRSVDSGRETNTKSKQAKLSQTAHTTQLSGATRNMRFMQRGKTSNMVTSRHSYPPQESKISVVTETAEEEVATKTSDANENSDRSIDRPKELIEECDDDNKNDISTSPKINNFTVKWEKATPLDMYGQNACIFIGRRSYNGFNSTTALNLHMQQQHLEYEEKLNHRRSSTNSKSDRRRYQELSKQVQKDEKQALPRGDRISKSKKKSLDEILKSVGS